MKRHTTAMLVIIVALFFSVVIYGWVTDCRDPDAVGYQPCTR